MSLLSRYLFRQVFGRNQAKGEENISKTTESLMGPNFALLKEYGKTGRSALENIAHETLELTTADGLKLIGYLYPCEQPTDKTVLCVHGYHWDGVSDFANITLEYRKRGFQVLLVNNRSCGPSEGEFASFGVRESEDTLLWISKLVELFPSCEIILQGCSMGAATVCMTADKRLPANVKLIVSDCAYATIQDQFAYTVRRFLHLPIRPTLHLLEKEFRKQFGCGFADYSPLQSVAHSQTPMLFVHGKEDRYVPVENAQKLYDACHAEKRLLLVGGAGHAAAQLYAKDDYYNKILKLASQFMALPRVSSAETSAASCLTRGL